jgi:hypothetical protein
MTSGPPWGAGPAGEWPTQPQPWSPSVFPPQPPPRKRAGRGLVLVAVAVVVAAIAGASVAIVVMRFSDRAPTVGTAAEAAATTTTSLPAATATTAPWPPARRTVDTAAARRAFVSQVETILEQSAQARAQVKNLVAGVTSGCAVAPGPASADIAQVIANRRSVLGQAAALDATSGPSAAAVRGSLVDALTKSIEADNQYEQWLDYLYSRYFNAYPVGCPLGAVPIDDHYRAATASSAAADVAKRSFVAAFDPIAEQLGLRTWTDTEF